MDLQFRIANIEVNDKRIANSYKGDAKKNIQQLKGYGYFARQKINNFNLVTGLRATENN
jgi:hypothetical protein